MYFALQLYTVRDHCTDGQQLLHALEQVKEAGYQGVEFAGTYNLPPEELKAKLDQLGLISLAGHVSLEDLENRLEEILQYHKILGSRAVVCAYAATNTEEELEYLERILIRAQQTASSYGIQVMYHNHSHEFREQSGKLPIDEIKQCCPLELDTYWVYNGGVDVPLYIQENKERIGLLHLKDGNKDGVPCAIGEGSNDISGILSAARAIGIDWAIVENDDPVPDGFSDMRRSIGYLLKNHGSIK